MRFFINFSDYLRAVLRQNIAFFDRVGAGEITNRVSHDGDLLQDGISDKVSAFLMTLPNGSLHSLSFLWEHFVPVSLSHTSEIGNSL